MFLLLDIATVMLVVNSVSIAMKNKDKLRKRHKEIEQKVADILIKKLLPKRIFLFGSRAKKTNGTHADFDFAVEGTRPDFNEERQIKEQIEQTSGLYKVDVVYLDDVDAGFRDIVLKTGKVIYEK